MLSNFHKTTSEPWWRTPGTQKGSPFSSKGGRTKYKRQKARQKSWGWRHSLGKESWRRSFQTARNPLTGMSVGNFGISEVNITGRNKQINGEYTSNRNSKQRSIPDAFVHHQWAGAEQEGDSWMLRVRTRLDCPEDNLRERLWDGNPNCGIDREGELKNREREVSHEKLYPTTEPGALTEWRIEGTPKERYPAV